MTETTRKIEAELRKLAAALAEINRGIARLDHNLALVEATANAARAGHRPMSNGRL